MVQGVLSSIASSAWQGGGATSSYHGAGRFADSGAGMIAFGTVSGGVGAKLTGGNFWQGAVTALVVSGLNHYMHKIQVKNELDEKYPGLYKVLSKLKTYVKSNPEVLESMLSTSGYTKVQLLKLLSVGNLVNIVRVGDTDDGLAWGIFRSAWPGLDFDPYHVYVRGDLVSSLDAGGYRDGTGTNESVYGASFFTGVTVLHELVHYGRFWNGLSRWMTLNGRGGFEAGQVFETWAFGDIQGITKSTENAKKNGW